MVARRLGVSRQLLRSWATSGKLQPAGYAPDGRPLYRLVDAAEVEQQTRNDPRSSRRRPPVGARL
jgi:DNA-binding transcriptional MerR regulator